MAFFRLELDNVKSDRSVERKFLYDFREGIYQKGKMSEELVYKEFGNLPEFAKDNPRFFWKTADTEERANGRKAKQLTLTLPNELSDEENIKLTKEYIEKTLKNDFPYTVSIHKKINDKGQENIHAHILFSTRKNDGIKRNYLKFFKQFIPKYPERGGCKKDQYWNDKESLIKLRKTFEKTVNKALAVNKINEKVDCRTLKNQRKEAIKSGDFIKAEKLDRPPINIEGYLLYDKKTVRNLAEIKKLEFFELAKKIKKYKDELYGIKIQNIEEENIKAKKELINKLIGNEEEFEYIRMITKEHNSYVTRLENNILEKEILNEKTDVIEDNNFIISKNNIGLVDLILEQELSINKSEKRMDFIEKALNPEKLREASINAISKGKYKKVLKKLESKELEILNLNNDLNKLDKVIILKDVLNISEKRKIVELKLLEKNKEKYKLENILLEYKDKKFISKVIAKESILKNNYINSYNKLKETRTNLVELNIGRGELKLHIGKLTIEEKKEYISNLYIHMKKLKDSKEQIQKTYIKVQEISKNIKENIYNEKSNNEYGELLDKLTKTNKRIKFYENDNLKEARDTNNINNTQIINSIIPGNLIKIEESKKEKIELELKIKKIEEAVKNIDILVLEKEKIIKPVLKEVTINHKNIENKIVSISDKIKLIRSIDEFDVYAKDYLKTTKLKNNNLSKNLNKLLRNTGKKVSSMGYKGEDEDEYER